MASLFHKKHDNTPREVNLTQEKFAREKKQAEAQARHNEHAHQFSRKNQTKKNKPVHEPGPLRRRINAWFERLLGAAQHGSFSKAEAEYAAGQTKQDYFWNTAGQTVWGAVFPLFTIIVTQLAGVEQAGIFSLAMVVGMLLMILGNYGVRTFQVSDIHENFSFTEYQVNRWLTCFLMLLAGYFFIRVRGFDTSIAQIFMAVFIYKMMDALADVYEGRLQQKDKLYLAGISIGIRSLAVLVVFTVILFITRNVFAASVAMDIAAIASFVIVTFPLSLLETPRSARLSIKRVAGLFKQCFPVFVALFLYNLIDNMPKFVMDGTLPYDNQLYFNALYFPAQMVLLIVGFVYRPMLVTISNAWADRSKRRRFDLFVLAMIALSAVLAIVGILLMGWIGIPIMSFLYGIDFEQFRTLSYIMIAAGGVTGAIDFLYSIITVMRHQRDVTKIYLITMVFAIVVPIMLIHIAELRGAVVGYFIVMCILLALLALEYVRVRYTYELHPELDPNSTEGKAARAEMHAEQQHDREVRREEKKTEHAAADKIASQRHSKVVRGQLQRKMHQQNGASSDAHSHTKSHTKRH